MQQLNCVPICILIIVVNDDRFCFTNGVVRGTMRFIELEDAWMKNAIRDGLLYNNKYFSGRPTFLFPHNNEEQNSEIFCVYLLLPVSFSLAEYFGF